MRIVVNSPGCRRVNLRLPSGLALNPVTAMFLPGIMKQNGVTLTRKQALTMVRAINRYRRRHPDWKLVEVKSSGGAYVEIVI